MSLSSRHVLVHYNEIALKGKNRRYFEDRLIDALRLGLQDLGVERVQRLEGRLLVELRDEPPWEEARRRLSRVFGVSHFARARRTALHLDAVKSELGEVLAAIPERPASFAIAARRSNKEFPINSMEINRELGAFVQERTGWPVSIDNPALPIYVYILRNEAFFSFDRNPGAGGLPRATAGKVGCLISGGIDSPVAAHRMMRRGCTLVFIHFHSFPHTSAASIEKAKQIVAELQRNRGPAILHLVPFAELQRRIVAQCHGPFSVLLYRRFMLRVAAAIAAREGALALVTGESLGQVASQTLQNLAAIQAAITLPVLRPLIGYDKLEIVREAERIGTFQLSVEPHDDCCSFLMPRNPSTRASTQALEEAEQVFDVPAEVETLVRASQREELGTATTPPPPASPSAAHRQ